MLQPPHLPDFNVVDQNHSKFLSELICKASGSAFQMRIWIPEANRMRIRNTRGVNITLFNFDSVHYATRDTAEEEWAVLGIRL
jgi:hypothetical protein